MPFLEIIILTASLFTLEGLAVLNKIFAQIQVIQVQIMQILRWVENKQ